MTTQIQLFHVFVWVVLLIFLPTITGCNKTKNLEAKTNLNVAVSVEISSLDPQVSSSIEAIKIQCALFETLVRIDPQSGEIIPAGAMAWEVSEGGTCYEFQLNPKLKWSDGTQLTAADYVFSFRRLFTPEIAAPFAPLYRDIVGADTASDDQFGVSAEGLFRLKIRLKRSVPYFLTLLARPCVAALPTEYLEENGAEASRITPWSLTSGFPSSGPYQLDDWVVNKHLRVRRNSHYWRCSEVEFDTIHFYPIESAYVQERGFLAGVIDVISKLASERIQSYVDSPDFVSQMEMGTFYVISNTDGKVFANWDHRNAFSNAIDRELIAAKIRRRGETIASSFTPQLWDHFNRSYEAYSNHNHEEHARLDSHRLQIQSSPRFLISSSESNLAIAEALQAMWMDKLGIRVEIVRQEWKSYLDSRNRGDFDLCLATWIGDYFDPLTFLDMWMPGATNNFSKWENDDFVMLLGQASQLPPGKRRMAVLAQAEAILMKEVPIFPIFYLSRVYLKSDAIVEWPQTLLNTLDYASLRRNRH